jgi:lipopolysaccharide/colanic/teichoic acid biosynthesis glycosyltransferase
MSTEIERAPKKPLPNFASGLVRRGKYGYTSYRRLKRIVDIVVSATALIVLSPVMLIIALCIIAADGTPVIFRQKRIGEDGKTFTMLKFRSMVKNAEEVLKRDPELYAKFQQSFKLENDPRILPIGNFIRKTSLDELPQLWNVLRGDMSIVGPRPIVEKELAMYGDKQDLYKAMKPGCAGLWQCSGRSDTTYEERVALDEQYFVSASIRNDIKILVMTFLAIVRRDGAK